MVKKQTGKRKMEPRSLNGEEFRIIFRSPLFILAYHIFILFFKHTVDLLHLLFLFVSSAFVLLYFIGF